MAARSEPVVLPDVSVWANAACSVKPAGHLRKLYVKFNRDFGYNDQILWGGYNDAENMLFVFTPTDAEPHESYQVRGFRNYISAEQRTPIVKGSVIPIINDLGFFDVSLIKTEFYV